RRCSTSRCASWPMRRWCRMRRRTRRWPPRGSMHEPVRSGTGGRQRPPVSTLTTARPAMPRHPSSQPKDIPMNTASRIALVTGATRGIGLETVRQLAEAGVHTLLAGRDRARAVDAALKLQAQGLPVEAIALDVTDAASIEAAAQEIERRHGRLDILVNNAGILADDPARPVSGQSLDAWRRTFDTNVFGLIAVTQALLPLLRRSDAGRIVNVSSALGSIGLHADPASFIYDMKIPAYNVSKSAVNAWTVQ